MLMITIAAGVTRSHAAQAASLNQGGPMSMIPIAAGVTRSHPCYQRSLGLQEAGQTSALAVSAMEARCRAPVHPSAAQPAALICDDAHDPFCFPAGSLHPVPRTRPSLVLLPGGFDGGA